MLPSKFYPESVVTRKGNKVQVHNPQDRGMIEDDSVVSNLLYEILHELKKQGRQR